MNNLVINTMIFLGLFLFTHIRIFEYVEFMHFGEFLFNLNLLLGNAKALFHFFHKFIFLGIICRGVQENQTRSTLWFYIISKTEFQNYIKSSWLLYNTVPVRMNVVQHLYQNITKHWMATKP